MPSIRGSNDNVMPIPVGGQPPRNSSLGSSWAWIIWVISVVFVLFQFCLQLTSGVLVAGLMKSFSLTAFGGGVLASSYYYIYVVLQAPAGFLIDRYGARRLLSIAAVVCALGCVLFATSGHLSMAILGRLLMGLGASFAFVGSMSLVLRWFPVERFGLMVAMVETTGMIGSLFGGYFLAHFVQELGWRESMEGAAVIGILIALLLWLLVRDAPKNSMPPAAARSKSDLWSDIKRLLKKPVVWLNGIYSSAVFGIITIFVALWGVPFMQKFHHLNLSTATLLCNVVFIGVAVGAPIVGWVDARLRSRKWLLFAMPLLSALILCLLIFDSGLSVIAVAMLMLLLGVNASSYVINFVIAQELSSEHTRSTAVGFTNMLSVISAPIFQPLLGLVLYLLSHHEMKTSLEAYSTAHFQIALSIIPLFVLIASVIAFWLPNRTA